MSSINSFYWIILVLALLLSTTYYLIRNPSFSFVVPTITKFQTEEKLIALSFDDGPNPSCTAQLLDLLEKHQVKASFFLIGKQVKSYPKLAKQILAVGHQVANHSYHHEKMIFKRQSYIEQDLLKTDALLQNLGCHNLDFYRPPYGYSFIKLPRVLKKHKKQLVTWNINPNAQYDLPQHPQRIIDQVLQQIHEGAIILLHDGGSFAQCDSLLIVVDEIIRSLKKQGYHFVTIEEGMDLKRIKQK